MSKDKEILDSIADKEYEHGFVTNVEQEFIPKGLNEDIIRLISAKKDEPEWMLEFRLKAFRRWQQMELPKWAHLDIPEIDFQDIIYYAAPKKAEDRPKEIDPELEKTFDKLGIPLHERDALLTSPWDTPWACPPQQGRGPALSSPRSEERRVG